MWFLTLLTWLAMLIQVVLLTLAVATGLFYLAELVEEYTSMSKRVITYMIYSTIGVYIGLFLFESMSISLIFAGITQQIFHLMLMRSFPHFIFSSVSFIGTAVLIVLNHYLAFSFFSDNWHQFTEVLAFFTICLWIVPFAFFISLSADDYTLPSTMNPAESARLLGNNSKDDLLSSYFNKKNKKVGLLSALKGAQEWVGLTFKNKKSF